MGPLIHRCFFNSKYYRTTPSTINCPAIDDFQGLKTSAEEIIADVVETARELEVKP